MAPPEIAPLAAVANVPGFVLACVICGLLAAFAMNVPMSRQEDGFAPAYVAAAVLSRASPEAVSFARAAAAHHAAGAAAGALYALSYLELSAALPATVAVGGVDLLSHLVAAAGVAAFVYAFFAHFVLPRAGRGVYEERATAVRGQWLRSSIVFGVAVGVIVPPIVTVV